MPPLLKSPSALQRDCCGCMHACQYRHGVLAGVHASTIACLHRMRPCTFVAHVIFSVRSGRVLRLQTGMAGSCLGMRVNRYQSMLTFCRHSVHHHPCLEHSCISHSRAAPSRSSVHSRAWCRSRSCSRLQSETGVSTCTHARLRLRARRNDNWHPVCYACLPTRHTKQSHLVASSTRESRLFTDVMIKSSEASLTKSSGFKSLHGCAPGPFHATDSVRGTPHHRHTTSSHEQTSNM